MFGLVPLFALMRPSLFLRRLGGLDPKPTLQIGPTNGEKREKADFG